MNTLERVIIPWGYSRQTPAQGAAPKVKPPVYPVSSNNTSPTGHLPLNTKRHKLQSSKSNIHSQIIRNARRSIMTNNKQRPDRRRGPPRHHPLSGSSRLRHRLGNHHWIEGTTGKGQLLNRSKYSNLSSNK